MTKLGLWLSRLCSRATATRAGTHGIAVAGRRSAVGAERAIWPEHLIDQAFGSNILNLGQDRWFLLFSVEPLANGVVDESHEAGRDNYAARAVSDSAKQMRPVYDDILTLTRPFGWPRFSRQQCTLSRARSNRPWLPLRALPSVRGRWARCKQAPVHCQP